MASECTLEKSYGTLTRSYLGAIYPRKKSFY
ncbi:hypothetical protein COLO4_00349 [Corchorus olitorius]|uniref:Uncharacterized protein n=1 Tax=Corchorus olitorius TaxID=93759 RepID=A0A1R3KZS6_9ROSI|nr:hypothetical protein COLO4_02971 [Corchorus olitorius]OMP14064.1 hypothetical protein COLO4_00349 [Corchorus olitorius]